MLPYQFYQVKRFPKLTSGQQVKTRVQLTFSGEGEDVDTSFTMENPKFEGSIGYVRVKSQIKHNTVGYIKTLVDHERRKLEFYEYLQPVDFPAFYDASRNVVMFKAPKKVCRGVLANIHSNECGVALQEMEVDFEKVLDICSEYLGAWFRGVSTRVHSAGLSGDQIQDDPLFKKLLKHGDLSNITVPWQFESAEHRVMLTRHGAIVLVQDYKDNQGIELAIVGDVFDRLLNRVWAARRARGGDDPEVAPDP